MTIQTLRPFQQEAQTLINDPNFRGLIVVAPTGSGKTKIVDFCVPKGRTILIGPLRALSDQQYRNYSVKYTTILDTGDTRTKLSRYEKPWELAFMTYEKFDSLLRSEKKRTTIMNRVRYVIVDEIHQIGRERGIRIESAIFKLKALYPEVKIVGLSATISNPEDIAQWLDIELRVVDQSERPIPLDIEYLTYKKVWSSREKINQKIKILQGIFQRFPGENFLVFCGPRDRTRELACIDAGLNRNTRDKNIVQTLLDLGVGIHHAGLIQKDRNLVEKAYEKRKISHIYATTTLSAGVNLPARHVAIFDVDRWSWLKSSFDFLGADEMNQMCIPSDQLITTEQGQIPIGELIDKMNYGNFTRVLSYNQKTGDVKFRPIVRTFSNGLKEIYKVTLSNGIEIKATEEHPFLKSIDPIMVYGDSEKNTWVPLKQLKPKDKILYCASDFVPSEPTDLYKYLLPDIDSIYICNLGKLIIDYIEQENITHKEFAERFEFSHKIEYHYRMNKKAMPLRIAYKIMYEMQCTENQVQKTISDTTIKTAYGNKWKLLNKLNRELLYLSGFVLSDGSVRKKHDKRSNATYFQVRLFNKNRDIINYLEKILKNLGLKYSKSTSKEGFVSIDIGNSVFAIFMKNWLEVPLKEKSQRMRIPSHIQNLPLPLLSAFIEGYFDGDGSYYTNKKHKIRRVMFSTNSREFANDLHNVLLRYGIFSIVTPYYNDEIRELRDGFIQQKNTSYWVVFRKKSHIYQFFRHVNPKKVEKNPSNCIHDIILKKYVPIEVKSIEYEGIENVYNLEIEGTNTFLCNNVVVHNCGRAGRPGFDDKGYAHIICSQNDLYSIRKIVNYPFAAHSQIKARLHELLLEWTVANIITQTNDLGFIPQTLFCGKSNPSLGVTLEELQAAMDYLVTNEFITTSMGHLRPTHKGKITSLLYIQPESALIFEKAHRLLLLLQNHGIEPSLAIIFCLMLHVNEFLDMVVIRQSATDQALETIGRAEVGLDFCPKCNSIISRSASFVCGHHGDRISLCPDSRMYKAFALTFYKSLTSKHKTQIKITYADHIRLAIQAERLLNSAAAIIQDQQITDKLKMLQLLAKKGTFDENLAGLMQISGIGDKYASKLINAGIKSRRKLIDTPLDILTRVFNSEKIARQIYENVRKL
jgi:replicative superfamily II helicase